MGSIFRLYDCRSDGNRSISSCLRWHRLWSHALAIRHLQSDHRWNDCVDFRRRPWRGRPGWAKSFSYVAQSSGASVQTFALTGLNGLADGDYDLFINIVVGHSGATYALASNLSNTSHYSSSFGPGGSVYTSASSLWPLTGGAGISGTNFSMTGSLVTRSGFPRYILLSGFSNTGATNNTAVLGYSLDESTNLTTLTLSSSQLDGIAAGTTIQAFSKGRS